LAVGPGVEVTHAVKALAKRAVKITNKDLRIRKVSIFKGIYQVPSPARMKDA
jgi:hypothetical protein